MMSVGSTRYPPPLHRGVCAGVLKVVTNPTVALDLKTRPAVARLGACLIMRAWTSDRSASEPSGGGDDI